MVPSPRRQLGTSAAPLVPMPHGLMLGGLKLDGRSTRGLLASGVCLRLGGEC